MKRKPSPYLPLLLGLLQLGVAADDTYQSYIQALAYPARLVVRPDPSSVVSDGRISFFCRADGNPLPNVVWRANGQSITESRFVTKSLPSGLSTLRIEPVRSDDNNTVISCSADNGVANPVVAEATLTVLEKDNLPPGFPSIDLHPSLKSVEQGRTAYVSCRVHGEPRPKVLWLRDLVPIDIRSEGRYSVSTIGNPGALMIQTAREEDQGKYECIARNNLGVVHSKAAHLYVKVRRVPPYFSMKLNRTYPVSAGGNVNLTCVAVGYPMPRVFWKKSDDGVVLHDPATAPIGKNVLTLSNIEQTENFTCVAVSKLGNIEATTTVLVKALHAPPRHFRISTVTADSVTLTWEAPRSKEGIKKYLIKYRQKSTSPAAVQSLEYGNSNAMREKSVNADQTQVTIGGLKPFHLYEFTAQVVGEVGPGQASIPRETQTAETTPSTPPIKLQARSLSRDSILVKWSPTEKPNGLITGYKIFYTNENPSTPYPMWKTHETKSDELMATLYNLAVDTKYFVRVHAKNSKGASPMSEMATVSTVYGLPGQPPCLQAKALDSRRVQLSWEKPLFSTPVTGYTIRFNDTEGEREVTLTSPHEKHLVTGLEPDTYYAFRVAAKSSRGQGEMTEAIAVKTLEAAPTGPPSLLSLVAVAPSVITVTWAPPDPNLRNGPLTQYRIRYRIVPSINSSSEEVSSEYDTDDDSEGVPLKWNESTIVGNVTTANLTGLQSYTSYEVTIAAATETGFGPESAALRMRSKEDGKFLLFKLIFISFRRR